MSLTFKLKTFSVSPKNMAVAVDPFSFATAELSEEYISVFPHPDIVPKYLETVSDKTGVQLLTGCNTLSIKGPWVSLKRVHSFLTEFLASYQTAELDQDEKDVELLDHSPPFPCDENYNEEEKSSPTPNSDARFHDSTGELSDWIKWTAEVLPRIQRTRSKRACVYTEPKSQAKRVPEPLVLYASFQPTPDPGAKKPPTLDAIEKVLKKVYDKDNVVTPESLDETENASHSKEISNAESSDFRNKVCPEPSDQTSAGSSYQENVQRKILTELKSGVHELQYDSNSDTKHFSRMCTSDITETTCATSGVNTTSTENMTTEPVLPIKEPSSENPHNIQEKKPIPGGTKENNANNQSADITVPSVTVSAVQFKTENSNLHGNEKQAEDSDPVSGKRGVADSDDRQLSTQSNAKNKKICLSTQSSSVERKIRRKGRPKKNEKYRKKKDDQSEGPSSSRSSRAERSRKRENSKVVKEPKASPEKKKRGRPAHPRVEADNTKEEEECYICELCSYAAKKLSHLREHKRRVHITKEFKCEKCGKVFGFGKDLKRHRHTHQKAENCCDICGKMYKGVRTLAEHKKSHEVDYIKPEFPCEFCQKIFSTKYVLAYHIKSEHLGIKKTYLCPTCGKSFSQKNSYLQHANVHMGIRPYQCDTCGRSFSYEKSLKEHKYMHDDNKQFECHVCHKKFRQSSGVAIHMKIHKERKDYVCSACGKGFSQKQALIRHERIHIGEKPFACALCHRTFTDSSILRRHMILVHKKDPKKWREDTENNVKRRTDFFISVVGEEGKVRKSDAASRDQAVSRISEHEREQVQASGDGNDAGGPCPAESVEDSFNFIAVGIGTVPSSHPSALPTMPPMSMTQETKISHAASSSSADTMAALNIHSHQADALSAVRKTEETGTTFALSLGPTLSKESTQPVDMSSNDPDSAQSSVLLSSFPYGDHNRLPSSEFYTGEMQHGAVSSVQLPQYTGVMAQGSGYSPAMVVMSDTLDTLNFQSGTMSVTAASRVQTVDYDSLVSHPTLQRQQYSDAQQ